MDIYQSSCCDVFYIEDLDILFTSPKGHSKGVGYAAWCEVEKLYPEVKV